MCIRQWESVLFLFAHRKLPFSLHLLPVRANREASMIQEINRGTKRKVSATRSTYIYVQAFDCTHFTRQRTFTLQQNVQQVPILRNMPTSREAAHALPSNFDMSGLTNAFSNPAQAFSMLDKNGDGRVTKEDLQKLLQEFGINGMAAKVLSKYIFKQLDANGNGTIEPSDLVHANGILASLSKMKQEGGAH